MNYTKIQREIRTYCPKCKKHTLHTVKLITQGVQKGRSMNKATRRHNRAIKGYVGSVEPKTGQRKKLSMSRVLLLNCKDCGFNVEKKMGGRSRKKIELKV